MYENYIYIYIYYIRLNEMSKNGFLNFLTLFPTQFLLLSEYISFLVMIGNMVSMIKVLVSFKFKFGTMIVFNC